MIEVDVTGKRAVLRDLNSLNGCFVNNVRIKGQREALSHGDNVRFGFDTRIWTVDCGSEKTPRQRKGSSGGWEFGCGGAAVSDAPAQPPVRGPPQLPSGGMPLPAFFDGAGVAHSPSPQPQQRRAMAPSPPEEEMRTYESDAFDAGGGGGGAQDEQEERARRRSEPDEQEEGSTKTWREEMSALQQQLREVQARQEEPPPRDGEEAWRSELAGLQEQLAELRRPASPGQAAAEPGEPPPSSGDGPSAAAKRWHAAAGALAEQGAAAPHDAPAESHPAEDLAPAHDGLSSLLAAVRASAANVHAVLSGHVGTSAADRLAPPPRPSSAPGLGGEGLASGLSEVLRRLQECERLGARLDDAPDDATAEARPPKKKKESPVHPDERMARLERLAVQQQQQLVGLRSRLGRRERQVLALSQRDGGQALLLAQQEAEEAQRAARRSEEELAELQKSLAQLACITGLGRSAGAPGSALLGGSALAGGGSGLDGGGVLGRPTLPTAALPAELQNFVIERAKETAALREQLGQLRQGAQRASRSWSALRAEADKAHTELQGAKQDFEERGKEGEALVAQAKDQLLEARATQDTLQKKLAETASLGATGGRAKAAEYVVTQLKLAKGKVRELEARCDELKKMHDDAVRAARAAAAGESSAERHGSAVQVAQLQDELTELRALTDVEAVARQQAVLQHLFKELRDERRHVEQLEAAMGLDVAGAEKAGAGGSSERRAEGVLSSLLEGKELQLQQMEGQMQQLKLLAQPEDDDDDDEGEGGAVPQRALAPAPAPSPAPAPQSSPPAAEPTPEQAPPAQEKVAETAPPAEEDAPTPSAAAMEAPAATTEAAEAEAEVGAEVGAEAGVGAEA